MANHEQLLQALKENINTPEYIVQHLQPRTIREIIATPCPSLSEIEDEATALTYIAIAIVVHAVEVIDVGITMSDAAVRDCASILYHRYPDLTLEDVILCLTRGKRGDYGPLYNTLNSSILIAWMQCYQARRHEVRQAYILEQLYDYHAE